MALTDQLRAAVDSPPPPGYDLDQLVHQARRGRALRRTATVAAGLAALALVAGTYVAATQLRPAEHNVQAGRPQAPAATQPAATVATTPATNTPTKATPASPARTIPRLNATLRQLPAAFGVPAHTSFTFRGPDPSYPFGYYNASWDHSGEHITIVINFTTDPLPAADSCGQPPTATCTPLFRPDVHAFLIKDPTQRFTIAVGSRSDATLVDIQAQRTDNGPLLDPHTLFQGTVLPGFSVKR